MHRKRVKIRNWEDVVENLIYRDVQAMGHDVATHKKHYQYGISDEEKRKQMIANKSIPTD